MRLSEADMLTAAEREARMYLRHSRAPTKDLVAEVYLRELGAAGSRILSLVAEIRGARRSKPGRKRATLRADLLPWETTGRRALEGASDDR